ncbi:nuclear transport factor 2 family protein [Streptomyces anulatus]|uniref:nuclear transport factor 2 family protein n=1 Tax=Streptomyces anulatus TaxID=1892 RepID=UPI0027E2FA1E|nr:nuclear transport factor 2 family protein [Streptomyces anulatus]
MNTIEKSGADAPDAARITDVLYAFARLADEGAPGDLGALLADDVEWRMAGTTWNGREETVAGLVRMRELGHAGPGAGNRHLITNQEVRVLGDSATARSYFLLVSSGAPAVVETVGSYRDELRRSGEGRWLIARREVTT